MENRINGDRNAWAMFWEEEINVYYIFTKSCILVFSFANKICPNYGKKCQNTPQSQNNAHENWVYSRWITLLNMWSTVLKALVRLADILFTK